MQLNARSMARILYRLDDELLAWVADRAALFRFRVRAAHYGLVIRRTRYGDPIAAIGLVLTITSFLGASQLPGHQPWGRTVGVVCAVGLWPAVRYLGNIGRIMKVASSSPLATERVFSDMAAGMANAHGYELLCAMYEPMLAELNASLHRDGWPGSIEFAEMSRTRDGGTHRYAAFVLPLPGATADHLMGKIVAPAAYPKDRATERQRLMAAHRGKHLDDLEEGDNYCLARLRVADGKAGLPGMQIDVSVGTYGQISRDCEALVNEFALFSLLTRPSTRAIRKSIESTMARARSATVLKCMKWRAEIHRSAATPEHIFLTPTGRAAGIGIAVVTLPPQRAHDDDVFVGMRSATVGTYPKCLHVIPAGNCNTHGSHLKGVALAPAVPDGYLTSVMRCEYVEEWFNDPDLDESKMPDWSLQVDQLWHAKVSGAVEITITGLAFDLLNLRPEICAMVGFDMSGKNSKLNNEWRGSPVSVPLAEAGAIAPPQIVQSGAAALRLAQIALGSSEADRQHEPEERSRA